MERSIPENNQISLTRYVFNNNNNNNSFPLITTPKNQTFI